MGFRYRKRIRIAPGISLNLSKSGISTSIGGKGATLNVGKRGCRGTIGIPGTGISYSQKLFAENNDIAGEGGGDSRFLNYLFFCAISFLAAVVIHYIVEFFL